MIISASYRTDIPAYYGRWFMARLAEGRCRVTNPYNGKPYEVPLDEGVDGFVFWTKNLAPFLPNLTTLSQQNRPFVVHYTINHAPRLLEPAAPSLAGAARHIRHVRRRFGPRALVWRYDPVVISNFTPPEWHIANFRRIAALLSDSCDEVVISFAHPYRKTKRGLGRLTPAGLEWRDPVPDEKRAIATRLAEIADGFGMRLTLCTQPDFADAALPPASCIDTARLSDVAGRKITGRIKGNRAGCECAESRDIGGFDSCPMGCAYCYAVSDMSGARAALRAHDPGAPML